MDTPESRKKTYNQLYYAKHREQQIQRVKEWRAKNGGCGKVGNRTRKGGVIYEVKRGSFILNFD